MATVLDYQLNPKEVLKHSKIVLERGGLVAIPSETVYGLGANVYSKKGIEGIYKAKNRAGDNPLITHISNYQMLEQIAHITKPEWTYQLIDHFWPGPLTLVFPKKITDPPCYVSEGYPTIAVRMPSHPIFLDLIEYCQFPIAAPSANISGRPSATNWQVVLKELGHKVDGIIKGDPSEIGIESTVLDLTQSVPVILRQGKITLSDIKSLIKETIQDDSSHHKNIKVIKSPGTKYQHYKPNFKIVLVKDLKLFQKTVSDSLKTNSERLAIMTPSSLTINTQTDTIYKKYKDSKDLSYHLYTWFYELEEQGVNKLIVYFDPKEEFGESVLERLIKSSDEYLF